MVYLNAISIHKIIFIMRLAVFFILALIVLNCGSSKKTTTIVEPADEVEMRSEAPGESGEFRQLRQEMLAELNLSEEQNTKFDEIQKKYRQQLQELRDNNSGDRRAMFQQARAINQDQRAEMKELLSEEQFAIYEEYTAKLREKMRERRGRQF